MFATSEYGQHDVGFTGVTISGYEIPISVYSDVGPDIGYLPISGISDIGYTRYCVTQYRVCPDNVSQNIVPDIGYNITIYRYRVHMTRYRVLARFQMMGAKDQDVYTRYFCYEVSKENYAF